MTSRVNPLPWLIWSAASVLLIVVTRNPLLLGLAGIAILIVRASIRSEARSDRMTWTLILRIGAIVAIVSVAFNLLTVHVGDRPLGHLPAAIPIVGGSLTLNALIYGLAGGLALIDLILVAATFSSAVDRGELIRLLPSSFGAAGTAAIVALSIFPQTLRAVREVHEAQASRGFRIRSIRDVEPLVVPVLHLGLEHAFELAESIEARGFGGATQSAVRPGLLQTLALPLGLAVAASGVVVAGLGHAFTGSLMLAAAVFAPLLARSKRDGLRPGRYRPLIWSRTDKVSLIASTSSILSLLTALVFTSSLGYSPYPVLEWPRLSPLPLISALLLVVPAFCSSSFGADG